MPLGRLKRLERCGREAGLAAGLRPALSSSGMSLGHSIQACCRGRAWLAAQAVNHVLYTRHGYRRRRQHGDPLE